MAARTNNERLPEPVATHAPRGAMASRRRGLRWRTAWSAPGEEVVDDHLWQAGVSARASWNRIGPKGRRAKSAPARRGR